MKLTILSVLVVACLSLGGWVMMAEANDEVLRSRIDHLSEDQFQKDTCFLKSAQLSPSIQGKRLLEVFPAADIKAVEIQGDEIVLPTALLLNVLTQARFQENTRKISVIQAPGGRIRLNDGNCFHFNVLLDPADGSVVSVQTPMGAMSVPGFPECKPLIPKVKVGMRRVEIEQKLQPDGGLSTAFKYERYESRNSKCTDKGEFVKMNFAFKPAGMTDAVYYLGKWVAPKTSPQDILIRISPPYIEMPYAD